MRFASTEAASPAPRAQYAVDREAYKRRMTEMRRQYLAERAALTATPQQSQAQAQSSERRSLQRSQEAAARAAERKRAQEVRRKNS